MYSKIIAFFEKNPLTLATFIATFFALIFTRLTSEYFMEGFTFRSGMHLWYECTHTLLFFLCAYTVFTLFFEKVFKVSLKTAGVVILFGFLVTLFPSIFDNFFPVQGRFYDPAGLWKQFITFFSGTPHVTVTHGARIEIAFIVATLGVLGYIKHKKVLKGLFTALGAYIIFFFFGTLASWIGIFLQLFDTSHKTITDVATAQYFITPVRIFSIDISNVFIAFNMRMSLVFAVLFLLAAATFLLFRSRAQTLAIVRNIRPPQVIYHFGLLILGGIFAFVFTAQSLDIGFFHIITIGLLLVAVLFAWLTSIIVNDLYDQSIDQVSNPQRPLTQNAFTEKQYKTLGFSFFGLSLFLTALVSPFLFLPMLGYHTLTWLYSAKPLRLKRIPYISSMMSACASILILLIGYIFISQEPTISHLPTRILWLLFIGYTLSIPIKDLKDAAGDKKDGVFTIPVLFGDYWGRVIIGSGIFLSFILSVWAINTPTLLWALLFGSLSFWTVIGHKNWKKIQISNRDLPFLILLYVILYGVILFISFL